MTCPGGAPGPLLLDERLGPVLKLSTDDDDRSLIYRLAALHEREQEEAESQRLLYVAATRARQKLLISGQVDLSTAKAHPGKLLPKGWLGELGTVVGLDRQRVDAPLEEARILDLQALGGHPVACSVWPLLPPQRPQPADEPQAPAVETDVAGRPPPLLAPLAAAGVEEEDERLQRREADPPRRVWRVVPKRKERPYAPAWVVGTLFHEALRRWRFPGDPGFMDLIRLHAQETGLTDEAQVDAAIARVQRLLRRFQEHDLFRQMARADRRRHEVPYSIVHGREARSRLIDVLYQTNGRWMVADFKTDKFDDKRALRTEKKVEQYRQQVREYVAAMRDLLHVEAGGQLVFLDAGGEIEVVTVDVD
jgi:ATP-dependent exoDNAse (exonuclease V) beta subunit